MRKSVPIFTVKLLAYLRHLCHLFPRQSGSVRYSIYAVCEP